MMGPEESRFLDEMVEFVALWHPELMDRISMADIHEVWDTYSDVISEARKRDKPVGMSRIQALRSKK